MGHPGDSIIAQGLAAAADTLDHTFGDYDPDDRGGQGGDGGGDPLPDDCQVRPLGHMDGTYYFADPEGQIREYRRLGEAEQISLFLGRTNWLVQNFADRKGNKAWNVTEAASRLINAAVRAGWYDGDAVRGPGVWWETFPEVDGLPGAIIIHYGDRLQRGHFIDDGDGQPRLRLEVPISAGRRIGRHLYKAVPGECRPANQPATEADAERLERFVGTWNFAKGEWDARLVMGFLSLSWMSGLLSRRPMAFLQAKPGAGKSALVTLIQLVNGRAWRRETFTGPGLRDELERARCARPLLLNEAEAKDDNQRFESVVELMRYNYTEGEGASTVYGRRTVPTSFLAFLAGVLPPPVRETDGSRRIVIKMLPLSASDEDVLDFDDRLAAMAALGPKLYRRVLWNWGRWRQTWRAYALGMMKAGFQKRDVDTWATVITGWDLLRWDDFDQSRVKQWLDVISPDTMEKPLSAPESCLVHLLTYRIDEWAGGGKRTIGEHLAEALEHIAGSHLRNEALRGVKRFGVTIITLGGTKTASGETMGGQDYIAIAKAHGGLETVFRGTDFVGGGWATALKDLDGADDSPVAIRLGTGAVSLGRSDGDKELRSRQFVLIPAEYLSHDAVAAVQPSGKIGELGDDE
ncbi:MAG: hypothetical protein ACM31D_04670 [Bacteroidota bacterium]